MQRIDRTRRVGELIKRALPNIIREHSAEWGFGLISITAAEVTRDLKNVRVYVTLLGDPADQKNATSMLNQDAKYFRKQLSSELNLRHTPTIEFQYDTSVEHGVRLSRLIDGLGVSEHSTIALDD